MTSSHVADPHHLDHHPMLDALARNWWLVLLRGLCAVAFGVLAFAWPRITLVTLVLLYGGFALADGILAIAAAIMGGRPAPRWWLAAMGLLGIAAGIVTLLWPGITAWVLLMFIAFWAIATGAMQIIGAIKLRKEIDNELFLILGGILSVIFGIVMLAQPGAGALALVLVIGGYAIVYGVLLIAFSLRLHRHAD
jgi:uncharacterized membrane protein HdeD (DUF308 family)